ncbi:hypothetical protein HYX17_02425 [Candidatus Woesearchaeota archaeon]|nr:hypothetical protein [Candidatus Woesearchaeota archaeon]
MEKKAFFRDREAREIAQLRLKNVYIQRGLVKRILDLDPEEEAIVLRTQMTPGRFFRGVENSAEASRKCYKHGDLIALSQPLTREEAYRTKEIPLAIRNRDFNKLKGMKEEDINFIGYSFYPVQGTDRRKRIVPFAWLPEGRDIFSYAENFANGIEINDFPDAKRVSREGADIVCRVPSRTEKKQRYELKLKHVPVDGVTERRAIPWSLRADYNGPGPEHSLFNIRYTWELEREGSDVITFYPHDIAAYIAVAGDYWKRHNLTPMEMNPFALISKKEYEFDKKLNNNILVYDPSLSSKTKLRTLHLDEKCILIGRSIPILGTEETMYWDPGRDGKLKDYDL